MTRAWHMVTEDGTTQYLKEREEVGVTYTFDGTPDLCNSGFHASIRLVYALKYAGGLRVKYCEMGGVIVEAEDKLCATKRTVLAELLPEQFKIILFTWLRDDILSSVFAIERKAGREPHRDSLAVVDVLTKAIDGTLTKEEAHAVYYEAKAVAYAAKAVAYAAYAVYYAANGVAYAAKAVYYAAKAVYYAADAVYYAADAADAAANAGLNLDELNAKLEARVLEAMGVKE